MRRTTPDLVGQRKTIYSAVSIGLLALSVLYVLWANYVVFVGGNLPLTSISLGEGSTGAGLTMLFIGDLIAIMVLWFVVDGTLLNLLHMVLRTGGRSRRTIVPAQGTREQAPTPQEGSAAHPQGAPAQAQQGWQQQQPAAQQQQPAQPSWQWPGQQDQPGQQQWSPQGQPWQSPSQQRQPTSPPPAPPTGPGSGSGSAQATLTRGGPEGPQGPGPANR
jgi:hypothetical protein